MPKLPNAGIPSYGSDGTRLRNYSLEQIERLLAMKPARVVVKRNKRTGRITSAQLMPLPQSSAAVDKAEILKHAHMGQRYSYPQRVGDSGHRTWSFTRFLTPRLEAGRHLEATDIEDWLRQVFRAVPLSCLKTNL